MKINSKHKKFVILLITMLVLISNITNAKICNFRIILYDPNHEQVAENTCTYDNETNVTINCTINYKKCFITGLYTLYYNDTEVGCSGTDEEVPWYFCDATMPNLKGTSPQYFSIAGDNNTEQVNAFWKVYDDGLQLYYPFERDSSTEVYDWSPNEHNGTLYGTNLVDGRVDNGQARNFDGVNDYIAVNNLYYSGSDAINKLTVCAWVKVNNPGHNIIASWDRSEYWRFTVGDDQLGGYSGYVGWDTHTVADGVNDMKSNSTVNDGDWHFVCGTFDSSTGAKRIYIDGDLDAKNLTAHTAGESLGSSNTRYGFIGVGSEASTFDGNKGPTNYFNGSLDEIYIYNKSLSYKEIVDLYLTGLIRHGLYRNDIASSSYTPTRGMLDEFTTDSSANYTQSGDMVNIDWKWQNNELVSEVNESKSEGYAYIDYKWFNATGKDILIEYDVKFNGQARWGGVRYRGVYCDVNPTRTGWRDDNQEFYDAITSVGSGDWNHIKLYIFANRTGYPSSSLYVNYEFRFYEEPIEKSSWSTDTVGFVSNYYDDTVEIDNFRITVLNDTIETADEDTPDTTPPNKISTPTLYVPDMSGRINVNWDPPSDGGNSYYFYLVAFDSQDNPTNIINNSGFENGKTAPWESYGEAGILAVSSVTSHFGNYSLYVTPTGAEHGAAQSIPNYVDYKGYTVKFGCWARAASGSLGVKIGGVGLKSGESETEATLTTSWQYIENIGQVNSAATQLKMFVITNNSETSGGNFYIDSCEMQALLSTTIAKGIKDYYVDETSGNPGADDSGWITDTSYEDAGLNCFSQYTYKVQARDKNNQAGSWSDEVSTYPILANYCSYGSGPQGFCLNDTDNLCYYTGTGCPYDPCPDPGTVSGNDCYYDNGASLDRSDDCTSSGCTGVSHETHPSCTVGDMTDSGANCWTGTSCMYNPGDACAADTDGWDYSTASTYCSAGVDTCCPDQGTIAESVSCTTNGPTGTTYDRDTTEARCESTATGCTAYSWLDDDGSGECCGDDGSSDNFNNPAPGASCCINGNVIANNSLDSTSQYLCLDGQIYGCNNNLGGVATQDGSCTRRSTYYCDGAGTGANTWKTQIANYATPDDCDGSGTEYPYGNDEAGTTYDPETCQGNRIENDYGNGVANQNQGYRCSLSYRGPYIGQCYLNQNGNTLTIRWDVSDENPETYSNSGHHRWRIDDDGTGTGTCDYSTNGCYYDTGLRNYCNNTDANEGTYGDYYETTMDWSDFITAPTVETTYYLEIGEEECGSGQINATEDPNNNEGSCTANATLCVPTGYSATADTDCCPIGDTTSEYPGKDDDDGKCIRCWTTNHTQREGTTGNGLCEQKCGADNSADEKTADSCDGTNGYVNGTCAYWNVADELNYACGCLMTSTKTYTNYWMIGGETNASVCCENKTGEWVIKEDYNSNLDPAPAEDDSACCDDSSDCNDDDVCRANGYASTDVDNDGDYDYCNSGEWVDCNTNSQCDTANGYHCVNNDCTNTCTTNTECPSGFFCSSTGYCQNKLNNGQTCTGVTYEGTPSSEDEACSSGYCDNDGVGATDDGWCFTPISAKYDSQDNKCEESGNSALNDNSDEYRAECRGTSGYVADDCTYYTDGDANEETCNCVPDQTTGDEGKGWQLGGEISNCCGDDSGEWYINTTIGSSWYTACCDSATDCVDETNNCRSGNEGQSYNNCNDDIDNDCDGYIDELDSDCCPTIEGNIFAVRNVSGTYCMKVDSNGDVAISGSIGTSCSNSPGNRDFVVRTPSQIVMWINHSNCRMCLLGDIYQAQSSITPGTNEFLVMNDTAYVLKIDNSGNLYVTGYVGSGCTI